MWASQARRLRFALAEGQEVLARGFVEIYPPHGKYQLVVQELEPRGAGAAALRLQQVKERLQADGLLDPARKRPLPFLPRRVGVATSPTGAALRDFLRVAARPVPGAPGARRALPRAGRGRRGDRVSAVRALCRRGVDVIVVTRGGGSQEELAAFNDERLARAIAACPVPVVSAVGHEVDVSVPTSSPTSAPRRRRTPRSSSRRSATSSWRALAALRARLDRALRARARGAAPGAARAPRRARRARATSSRASATGSTISCTARGGRVRAPRRGASGPARRAPRPPRAAGAAARTSARSAPRMEAATRRLGAWQAAYFRREGLRLERLQARLEPANVAKLLARGFALVLERRPPRRAERRGGARRRAPLALGEGWVDARVDVARRREDPLPGRVGPAGMAPCVRRLRRGRPLTPFCAVVKYKVSEDRVSQASERQSDGARGGVRRARRAARARGDGARGGQLTLEQSIERFAEGVRLARDASRKLDDAERRVELLVRTADGGEEAVPFEPEAGKGR